MADTQHFHYGFTVEGHASNLFSLVEFKGQEELSSPYAFVVTLASADPGLAPAAFLNQPARLSIVCESSRGPDDDTGDANAAQDPNQRKRSDSTTAPSVTNTYSGVIFSFKYMLTLQGITFYQAVLTPSLRLLALTQHNQVFLGKSLPEIIKQVFAEALLTRYDLRLQNGYPPLEYVCQYNESSYNFLARLMEHHGLYYFFEETEQGEQLIITDTLAAHIPCLTPDLSFQPASGLDHTQAGHSVKKFVGKNRIVPSKVILKDYNPERPDLELMAEAVVDPAGSGTYYSYYDHFETQDQGAALARIRAEELLTGQERYSGVSSAPALRAGCLFTLSGHPYAGYNAPFLVTRVEHQGRNKAYKAAGMEERKGAGEQEPLFSNTFEAIPAARQFRPERNAQKTRIQGLLHATVDAEGDTQYAMIDDQGRYKIRLPFDLAGRPDGKASHWIRLAEPYAGAGHGMHFPLHKGSEVVLSFIDGDPDRPLIASAMFNGRNTNLVKDANRGLNSIKTAGNNQLVMGDKKGQEFIGLYSPFHHSSISLGSTKPGGGGSLDFKTEGASEWFVAGNENKCVVGTKNEAAVGICSEINVAAKTEVTAGFRTEYCFGPHFERTVGPGLEVGEESLSLFKEKEMGAYESVELRAGYAPDLVAKLENLKKYYHAMSIATAVGSVAASAVSESFTDEGCFSDDSSAVTDGVGYGGAALLTASAVVLAAAMAKLWNAIKDAQSVDEAWVSSVNLTEEGISIEACGGNLPPIIPANVPPQQPPPPATTQKLETGISLKVLKKDITGALENTSSLSFEEDTKVVLLANQEPPPAQQKRQLGKAAYLMLEGAEKGTLRVQDTVGVELHVDAANPDHDTVKLWHKGGSTCLCNTKQVQLAAPQGAQTVTLDDKQVLLAQGANNTITMKDDKIQVACTEFSIGTAFKVTASRVEIGGELSTTGSAVVKGDLTVEQSATIATNLNLTAHPRVKNPNAYW